MNRNEIITRVKELGLKTERPAQQCKTDYLQELLDKYNLNVSKEKRRGRPIVEGSTRQIRLSLKGTLKRGRRPNPESASYKRKMELETKRASGELRRGRPSKN
jgi:hypothetical protein